MSLTSIIRPFFLPRYRQLCRFAIECVSIQEHQLAALLSAAKNTEYGRKYGFTEIRNYEDFLASVPLVGYEDLRPYVMRMVNGEADILWKGKVKNFAQSSGTSGGKSKYIPISKEAFKNQYSGGFDSVACYLAHNAKSRLFDGKAFILGGSFATELHTNAVVGDLSANLIYNINPLVNMVRVPGKQVAQMEDWSKKLPALVEASKNQNITNISGVPSWFLSVIKEVLKAKGAASIHEVWPNLEVFFHGGINFKPYQSQYDAIADPSKMKYLETYNASEGFFAVQSEPDSKAMLLLLDSGVFYEFIPLSETDKECPQAISIADIQVGKTYELVITACNGLWRYRIGDTVKIEQVNPVKITIAGRTKHFINAFGEELMVHNADEALATACRVCNAMVENYTVAPVFATSTTKGRHEWLIEFAKQPDDIQAFAATLDRELQRVNSDYEAKRFQNLFIEQLSIIEANKGLFDKWLLLKSGRLGGQRKIPRLFNDRSIIESMLELNNQ